jgi:ABC-2 type transport system ATP-binding protein
VRFSGSSPRARRAELAYAGEADVLDPWLSPAAAMRLMGGLFADFSPERCRDLLAFLEVPERPYRRMSKGQQARFRLALALARQTRLLLLDEPLSGIDLISRERILRALLRSWNDQGTLVLSTHEVAEAEALFDRVLFLREGRLVLDARAEQLREAGKSVVQTFQELLA